MGASTNGARGAPAVPTGPRVSVVLAALNEARNLEHVLPRIGDVFEVILVDGSSTDDTVAVARDLLPDIRIIQQNRTGKGNALACGFHACRGDIIVMLDADGSTDPGEIPAFVAALRTGAHFAKGTRFALGGGSDDITRLRRWGNGALNRLVNRLYGTAYSDLCYGYNAFWAECLPHLDVSEPGYEVPAGESPHLHPGTDEVRWGDGFEIETLLTVRVSMRGLSVAEVPSFESPRVHGRSNLHAARDGWRVLHTIATERRRLATTGGVGGAGLPRPWLRTFEAPDASPAPTDTRVDHGEVIDLVALENEAHTVTVLAFASTPDRTSRADRSDASVRAAEVPSPSGSRP